SSSVLEVGCGTGQLARQLAARGVDVTAIDIGPTMVAMARRRETSGSVAFQVISFEEYAADDGSFDLIVSADALHWIDPEVKFCKSARLLRTGGRLALLSIEQVYDEPLRTELQAIWVARSDDTGAWLREPGPTIAEAISDSGLFETPIETRLPTRRWLPALSVIDLECTRATYLGWDENARRAFTEELSSLLRSNPVELTEVAAVTLAQPRT
ncbi:MAG: class I SAM-dependent methyltransferase, partial [Acidimicrobiales bacterium]